MFEGCGNHYLVYGITKAHNLFIIQAHPYRDGRNFPTPECVEVWRCITVIIQGIDCIEVIDINVEHICEDSDYLWVVRENQE